MSDTRLPGPHLRRLKALGQILKPVVHVGKGGLTDAVVATVDQALTDHELIKVKFDALKEQKKELAPELATRTSSHVVQRVGHVVVLFRRNADSARHKIMLPGDAPKAAEVPPASDSDART
jgi:RNA-binding protein